MSSGIDEKRPAIQPEVTAIDQMLDLLGWLFLGVLWITAIILYLKLPETVPSHFNLAGQVDGYSSKISLFFLPVIGTLLFALLTFLKRYPHKFNYSVKITERNAAFQYRNAARTIRVVNVGVPALFTLILLYIYLETKGIWNVNAAMIIVPIILFEVVIFFFVIRSFKK